MFVYLSVGKKSVSSVLVRESQGVQWPIYYASKLLRGAEVGYSEIEKVGLALVSAARKLRPYFLSHPIIVRTSFPLKTTLGKVDASGRMMKWAVELGQFEISYEPRLAAKGQALADFIQEATYEGEDQGLWNIFVDGSATMGGSGAGIFVVTPEGEELEYAVKLDFRASNNEAEYEALLKGLNIASSLGARNVHIFSDSQLVVQQVREEFATKDERMIQYVRKIRDLMSVFNKCVLSQIPREENGKADFLARIGSSAIGRQNRKIELIFAGKNVITTEVMTAQTKEDWRTGIIQCLKGITLTSTREQSRIEARARHFFLDADILFKFSFSHNALRCLGETEAEYVMSEVHQGCCGDHSGGRSLARRLLLTGYYWPTMRRDAVQYVQRCKSCQLHGSLIHQSGEEMSIITAPYPFAQWGIDIVGPFPLAPGSRKFLIVAIDYFSKWVEAEALRNITDTEVMKFVWENICCRYGVPKDLISDNGTQFNSKRIRAWCTSMKIRQRFTSVAHPQANGQVEVTNRVIVEGIKKKLKKAGGGWANELHGILWAHRTTPKEATGETPFALVHGTEAVLPVEVEMETARMMKLDHGENQLALRNELDFVLEKREKAAEKMEANKKRVKKSYDKKARKRRFGVGDWVLRQADALKSTGKLEPNWEGPYKVITVLAGGAYELMDLEGRKIARPWNINHLKKFVY